MSSIAANIIQLKSTLPQSVSLVAVSKFHPVSALQEAYDAGQRIFGESRAQELVAKQKVLPADIEWHFIGPLQSNKVKDIVPFISMIESIDSLKLLQEVNKQAAKHDRIVRVLLDECRPLLRDRTPAPFPHVRNCGRMGMATNTDDPTQLEKEVHALHAFFTELKTSFLQTDEQFQELSMGMSHDYPIAIREGSTMIRVGTHIFGEREY